MPSSGNWLEFKESIGVPEGVGDGEDSIREATGGTFLGLGGNQQCFGQSLRPRAEENKEKGFVLKVVNRNKFHPCKKIIRKASHKYRPLRKVLENIPYLNSAHPFFLSGGVDLYF